MDIKVEDYCLNCKNYLKYRGFTIHKFCRITEEDVYDHILTWIMKVGCRSFEKK
jgi:hypothetical protein